MKRLFLIAFAGVVVCWCEATSNSTTPPSQPSSRSNPRHFHHDPLPLNLSSTVRVPSSQSHHVDNLHSGLGPINPDVPVSVFHFLLPNYNQHVFRVTRFNLSAMSPQSPFQSLLQRHISSTTHSPIPSDPFQQLPNNSHLTPVDISPFLYTTTTNAPPVAPPFRSRQPQLQHRFQAPKSSNTHSYSSRSQQQQQPPQMDLLGDYGEELQLPPPARTHQIGSRPMHHHIMTQSPRPHAKVQWAGEYGSRLTQSQRTPTQTHTFQGTRRQEHKPTPVTQQRLPQSKDQRTRNHPKKTPPPPVFGAHDDNDPFEDMENQIEGLQQLPQQHQKYLLHLLQHLQTHQPTKPSRRTPITQQLRRSQPPSDYTKVPVVQVTPARLHSEHHSSRLQSLRPQHGHFHPQPHQLPTNQPFLQRHPPNTWSATYDEAEDDLDDEYDDEMKVEELDKEPAETRTRHNYAPLTPPYSAPPAPIHPNQRNQFPQHHSMGGYSQAHATPNTQLFQPLPQQHNNNNPVYAPWNSTLLNQPQRVSQTQGQIQGPVLRQTEKAKEKQVEESTRLGNLSTTPAPIAQVLTNKTKDKPKKKYKLKFEFVLVDPDDLDEVEEEPKPVVVSKPKPK